jgi:hypothetical protein
MTQASRILFAIVALGAFGCAHPVKNMREVATVNAAATPNDAVVIFMRPSEMAFAVQSSVFEVPENQPAHLVGIIAAKKKVAYRTTPGRHMFMIMGESADFMDAMLEPGRVYYALATVRMGVWKARFSLKPVHAAELPALGAWLPDTSWVELSDESLQWAQQNAASVEQKRAAYFAKWMEKQPGDRPALLPEDGKP